MIYNFCCWIRRSCGPIRCILPYIFIFFVLSSICCSVSATTSDLYNYENFNKFVYDGYVDISVMDSDYEYHHYKTLTSDFSSFSIEPGFSFNGFKFSIYDSSVINQNFTLNDSIVLGHNICLTFPVDTNINSVYEIPEEFSLRIDFVDSYGSNYFFVTGLDFDFSVDSTEDQIFLYLNLDSPIYYLFESFDTDYVESFESGTITSITYRIGEFFTDALSVEVSPQYGSLDGSIDEFIYYCVGDSQYIPDYTPVTEFNFLEQSEMVVLSGIKWAKSGVENMTSSPLFVFFVLLAFMGAGTYMGKRLTS